MKKIAITVVAMLMAFSFPSNAADLNETNPLIHYVGLNLGTTTIFEHYTSLHVGLNYELKKFKGRNGIGFDFEYMMGPGTEIFISFPISFHNAFKVWNLVISAAPGLGINSSLNYLKKEIEDIPEEDKFLSDQTRQNLLLRGIVSYKFPIKNEQGNEFMAVAPYMNVTFIADYNTYLSFGTKVHFYIYK